MLYLFSNYIYVLEATIFLSCKEDYEPAKSKLVIDATSAFKFIVLTLLEKSKLSSIVFSYFLHISRLIFILDCLYGDGEILLSLVWDIKLGD